MENEIVVLVRREITLRMRGDYVAQWITVPTYELEIPEIGRSLRTLERRIRKSVGPEVSIRFRLADQGVAPDRVAVVSAQRAALAEALRADAALIEVTRVALKQLLEGTPSISLRDAAELLGLEKSFLQEIAVDHVALDGAARIRKRAREKRDHEAGIWAAMRARREARRLERERG